MARPKGNRISWEVPQSMVADVEYIARQKGLKASAWLRELVQKEIARSKTADNI